MGGSADGSTTGGSSAMGNLAFERRGCGEPLVLLHGVGHRRQAWYPVFDLLAAERTVYALDLPGHGESPPLGAGSGTGRSAIEAMAIAIFAFFDEVGLDRPHVAGNSLGGALALYAGASGRSASVTCLSPGGFWSGVWEFPYVKMMFLGAELTGAAMRNLIPVLARSTVGRAVMDAAFVASPARMTSEQVVEDAYAFFHARDAVAAVLAERVAFTDAIPPDVPVTIAWGTRDRLLPPSQARVALHQIPQARFITLPGCGHVPMTDNPELVAQVILDGSCGR